MAPLPPAPPAPPPSTAMPVSLLAANDIINVVPTLTFDDDKEVDPNNKALMITNAAKTPDGGFGDPAVRFYLFTDPCIELTHALLFVSICSQSYNLFLAFTFITGLYFVECLANGIR